MPSTLLFAVNNEGRIFGLSTKGTKWREFIYLGLEFKQLSAVPNFLWAVGCDRQIYVHAHGLDVPIRVKEEAYENERWSPFEGFTKKLLPTDRYNFSNIDGTVDRSLKKIRLPSMAWQWEGDWKLELTLDGHLLDHDGWTYAFDFSYTYYPTVQRTSYVRRRKWVRHRKYIALNSWCAIAPLHKDPTREPFIGVSVGGNQLPGNSDGTMLVWAVTAYGRLIFRTKVSNTSPEGQRWMSVSVPQGCEVKQVSVGATGLVWVVLQNGKALVRTGITKGCFIGTEWSEVESPDTDLFLNEVSIGYNSLWAITRDFKVWFRKGIQGCISGVNERSAKGTGWVEMCGYMSSISVAPNDQVWAVGAEDRVLYFRTSVTQEDLKGKTWRAVSAPTQFSRTNSLVSLSSEIPGTPKKKRHRSWTSLNRHSGSHETKPNVEDYINKKCYSAPDNAHNAWEKSSDISSVQSFSSIPNSDSDNLATSYHNNMCTISENTFKENLEEKMQDVKEYSCQKEGEDEQNDSTSAYENVSHPVCGFINKGIFSEVTVPTRTWSPLDAGGTIVATEAHYAADSIVFESDELAGIYSEHGEREEEDDHLYWADSDAFWSTVEAGACFVDINYMPNWFSDITSNKETEFLEPWRLKIINSLKRRLPSTFEGLQNYEKAVDNSKVGKCKCLLTGETIYRECCIELKWMSDEKDYQDCTLTVYSTNEYDSWVKIKVRDLTAVINCSMPRSPRLALYYNALGPLMLEFSEENEYDEWKSELSSVCSRIRNIKNSPSSHSIWVTTILGDIYVCDLSLTEMEQKTGEGDAYSIELRFTGSKMPVEVPLYAGFLPGSSLTFQGYICDKAEMLFIDLVCKDENGTSNIAFHFNPRLNEEVIVQNTRKNSVWGKEERRQYQMFKPEYVFKIKICCEAECFVVFVEDEEFSRFTIRGDSEDTSLTSARITHFCCGGDISLSKVEYSANELIIEPSSLFWRQINGNLKKVQTAGGITWGIGFDNLAWIYLGSESLGRQKMRRIHYYYIYENQRWMPFKGFTSHGLPTDRFMWTDVTGRYKRTRETTILPSKKWQWVNEWNIDFQTPGGVDNEGWQYAFDFPYSYHSTQQYTDYVRRRRWFRCARLETEGPWANFDCVPLADCSLYAFGEDIMVWVVATNGKVFFRRGVSRVCPEGLFWDHVPSDEQMVSVSCGLNQVCVVGKSGTAFCRLGISPENPKGDTWEPIQVPTGTSIRQISVGESGIWAVDSYGKVSFQKDVCNTFPFRSDWITLPLFSLEDNLQDSWQSPSTPLGSSSIGFRQITSKNKLWAVTESGRLVFRLAMNSANPTGSLWLLGIKANFLDISL